MAGPLALIILDGFGQGAASKANAVTVAEPKFYMDLRQRYPFTTLTASGEDRRRRDAPRSRPGTGRRADQCVLLLPS